MLIIAVLVPISIAFAQVDTLMLVEENSVEVPDSITNIYVENITDSAKAIFITTGNHIYAYDSQSLDLIWTSPALTNPRDLQFADIDSDGFTDIAVQDSFNIYLFDITNDQIIWTSQELDSTYRCYAIGDLNDDNLADLVIANHYSFGDTCIHDTLRNTIYLAPGYSLESEFDLVLVNGQTSPYSSVGEAVKKIIISEIPHESGFAKCIILYTDWGSSYHEPGHNGDHAGSGKTYVFDAASLVLYHTQTTGFCLVNKIINLADGIAVLSINRDDRGSDYSNTTKIIQNICRADTILNSIIWQGTNSIYEPRPHWLNCAVDKINSYSDLGICFKINDYYGDFDSLYLYSLPALEVNWYQTPIPEVMAPISTFYNQNYFNNYQFLLQKSNSNFKYELVDVLSGQISAVLGTNSITVSATEDLDLDGNDEILYKNGAALHIYHLDYYIDIDEPVTIPYSTFLHSNYPNPFNAATTIKYGLADDQHVTIKIFDLLGRVVATIVDEDKTAGLYHAIWHAKDVPSGVYFYKISAGEYSKIRKMVLLK